MQAKYYSEMIKHMKSVLILCVEMMVGIACGKEVTLTFSGAGTMSQKGTWTMGGVPCTKDDLADGDTFIVDTGSISGGTVNFESFETPRLAEFRQTGTGISNLVGLRLNMLDNGVLNIQNDRVILFTGFLINPNDGEDSMKTVVQQGGGELQIRNPQTGCFKFRLTSGCTLYLHYSNALGPEYSTPIADSLYLENGATLCSGFANTADRDVTLPSTHGVRVADGAAVTVRTVSSAQNSWCLAIAGPISGTGVTVNLSGGSSDSQYISLGGVNTFTGTLNFSKKFRIMTDNAISKYVTLASQDADAFLCLNGHVVTVGALDATKGFGGIKGPGILKLDCAFADLPNVACLDGAALAVADEQSQPGEVVAVTAGTARAVTLSTETALTKTGDGDLLVLGSTAALQTIDVQAGSLELEPLSATVADVTVANGATLRAFGGAASYEFRFTKTVGNGQPVSLSEIALTQGGIPLDKALYKVVTASDGSENVQNLIDGIGKTFWTSNVRIGSLESVSVRVDLVRPVAIDGYRLGTGDSVTGLTNPTDWTLVACRLGQELQLDSRVNAVLATYGSVGILKIGNFAPAFSCATAVPASVSSGTDLTLASGATLEMDGGVATLGSLSGTGLLALVDGVRLTVNSLVGWTGDVCSEDATSTLTLGSNGIVKTPGSADLVLTSTNGSSIALDTSTDGTFLCGKLSGSVGLSKVGAGTTWIGTENAESTGQVAVVAGRCCVSARRAGFHHLPCTARYIRFKPLAYTSKSNTYNWELGEIELTNADGVRIDWPAGTTVVPQYGDLAMVDKTALIDGNYKNRACSIASKCESFDDLQYVTIDTQTGVTFAGYAVYPPYNTSSSFTADCSRTVKRWRVLVSDDGENFTVWDENEFIPNVTIPTTWDEFVAASPIKIGPYFEAVPTAETSVTTLPAEFIVSSSDPLGTKAVALAARYIRFAPYGRNGDDSLTSGNFGIAISEFDLYRNGERVAWSGATATSDADYYIGNAANAVDNNFENRSYSANNPYSLTIDAGSTVTFDAYGFHNDTANVYRSPVSWKLYVSTDGTSWYEADAINGATISHGAAAAEGPWSVAGKWPVPARQNVLGDAAPVSVSAGAELWVSTDAEMVGALSGAGRVTLYENSLLAINPNPSEESVFAGTIDGVGTLVISGSGVQTFDGANLNGVTRLELVGGTLSGSAVVGHDLTISFAGGALAGELLDVGALTVEGDVSFFVPPTTHDRFVQPLLSWTSIDSLSMEKLSQAVILNSSSLKTEDIRVVVTDHSCLLKHVKPGFVLIVR